VSSRSASKLEILAACQNELGEMPIWNAADNALYWIDIHAATLLRMDWETQEYTRIPVPDVIGSYTFYANGDMLLALRTGLYRFNPSTREATPLASPENMPPDHRFNEGKCDRRGRFWCGTMHDTNRKPVGSLYRFDPDLTLHHVFGDVIVPNCLAWSPDNQFMYFADTRQYRITRYLYDIDTGELGRGALFVDCGSHPGRPDGGTVDAHGCLWSAEFGGSRVVRYTPQGEIDRVIELPVTQITSCTFAGPKLDTLVITTARTYRSDEQRQLQPLAGNLFAINLGIEGIAEPVFAGQ